MIKSFFSSFSKTNGILYNLDRPTTSNIFKGDDEQFDFDLLGEQIAGTFGYIIKGTTPVGPEVAERMLVLTQGRSFLRTLIQRSKDNHYLRQYFLFNEMMRGWVLYHLQEEDYSQLPACIDDIKFTSDESPYPFLGFLLHNLGLHAYNELTNTLSEENIDVLKMLDFHFTKILEAQEQNNAAILVESMAVLEGTRAAHASLLTDLVKIDFSSTATRAYVVCLAFLEMWIPTQVHE